MSSFADTPTPPYYAVLFTSQHSEAATDGYADMADRMGKLAAQQPGFLGIESVRGPDGVGITISYWDSLEAIHAWGEHAEHRVAQALGRTRWYDAFRLRICRVEEDGSFVSASAKPI